MSALHPSYRVNAPTVVAQTIDQQTIIIHFDTGLYYSTNSTGALVWSLIENGAGVDRIVAIVESSYSYDVQAVQDSVSAFIKELETEQLIVPSDDPSAAIEAIIPTDKRFEVPVLSKYSDMAELLLLDPVHEIEDRSKNNA